MERFAAGYFAGALQTFHVPGAVFVVVKDGRILFAGGYGYANIARRTPVIPDRTVFRLCSVSKVFTATAAMQLVEQGKLRLDADVNRYLATFKLPKTFPQPVTVADLLTHTGGFDERHIGRSTLDSKSLQPLGPFLAKEMPPPVTPPGDIYSYSDFGYALLGYIVQRVSGEPFDRYLQQHIFQPLGMAHSSFRQPLPLALAAHLATGYDVDGNGAAHAAPIEYFNTWPASAMVGTASDVAHFMIAQLDGGSFQGRRILRPRTVREMQRERFSSYPPGYTTPGVAYGFGVSYWNGRRLLDHSGSLRGFSSLITLLPAQRIGLFIAGTTPHDAFLFDLRQRFMDRYYPASGPPPTPATPSRLRGGLDRFVGSYWSHEYSRLTIEKLRQLVNQVQVGVGGNGELTAHFWTGQAAHVTRVAPLLFATVTDRNLSYWAFQQDAHGQIVRMVPGGYEVYDKIQWYETTQVQLELIVALVLTALSGCFIWLILPMRRTGLSGSSRGQRTASTWSRGATAAAWLLGANSALTLLFLVGMVLLMLNAVSMEAEHYSWIEYGVPPIGVALLCIPLVTTALTAVLTVCTVLAWSRHYWSLPARLHYTVVTLGALALIPFLLYWNLLGFRF